MAGLHELLQEMRAGQALIRYLLEAHPELADDDPEFFAEQVLNETEISKAVQKILQMQWDAETMSAALDSQIETLKTRKSRLDTSGTKLKKYLHIVMDELGIPGFKFPEATVSLAKGVPIAVIDDAKVDFDFIDAKFVKTVKEQTIKKAEVLAALKSGTKLDFATLGTSAQSIRISRK